MKKRNKLIATSVLAIACSSCLGLATACSLDAFNGLPFFGTNAPQFLEGAITEVTIGESVLIDEFVALDKSQKYTLIITDPMGNSKDYSSRQLWQPDEIGEYTFTYTIEGKGSATYTVTVVPFDISWEFDNRQTVLLQRDEAIDFEYLFNIMNVSVETYCEYTLTMMSVTVDGVKTEFTNETSFTPTSLSDHVFRFCVDTEDGQHKEATLIVEIQYMSAEAKAFLEENNAKAYNYKVVDGTWEWSQGSFAGKAANLSRTDLPYLAFEGNYGAGDYVTFDFTGNNMPQLCFFVDEITPDLVDGKSGVYITNGVMQSMSTESKRLTIYGPNKIAEKGLGGTNRIKTEVNSAIGGAFLNENTRYRYIAGIKESNPVDTENLTYDETSKKWLNTGTATLQLLLVNLDEGTVVYDNTIVLDPYNNLTNQDQKRHFTEYNLSGSIVAYGNFDKSRVWDKVYPVSRGVSDIHDLISLAEMKPNSAKTVKMGVTLNTSDYISTADEVYEFYFTDENGVKTEITGETFSFPKAGTYRLYYDPIESSLIKTSIQITVEDISDTVWEWMEENGVQTYKARIGSNGETTAEVATFTGKSASVGSTDNPYVAFKGDYGEGDYVIFDFTGKYNMPQLTFLADVISPNLVDGNAGIYLSNGYIDTMSAYASRYIVYGPNKLAQKNLVEFDKIKAEANSNLGIVNLEDNKHYRYIAGIKEVSQDFATVTLQVLLVDLDMGKIVRDLEWALDVSKYNLDESYFHGNIVAHANFCYLTKEGTTPYEAVTWDKIYPVQRNVGDGRELLNFSEFKTEIETTVKAGQTLSVSDYIETQNGGSYEMYYVDQNGERTDVEGETFSFPAIGAYTLYYCKYGELGTTVTVSVQNIAEGLKVYGVTEFTNENGVTLGAGTFTGEAINAIGSTDSSYVAFTKDGGFGAGSFVVVEFTGNNLPYISFFADEVSETTKNFVGTNGILFSGGICDSTGYTTGSVGSYYRAYYPTNMFDDAGKSGVLGIFKDTTDYVTEADVNGTAKKVCPLSHFGLKATPDTKYRLILGFEKVEEANAGANWKVTVSVKLINLDTGATAYEATSEFSKAKTTFGDIDFTGSIILYGRPYMQTKLDKVYAIYENTTLAAVEASLPSK